MFFTGTLQEGIATALQQTKLVTCFVTDDGPESKLWEDEYLNDDSIREALRTGSILLRLVAGSQEAGYLAALFPIPKTPTLVIIKNGELKEYIASGVSKADFLARVARAFPEASAPTASAGAPRAPTATSSRRPAARTSASAGAPETATSELQAQERANLVQAAMARREREKQDAQRRRKEAEQAEAARRQQSGDDAGGSASQPLQGDAGKPRDEVKKAAEKRKREQLAAQEARRRVLKQIEDDRKERKSRDEQQRLARQEAAALAADEEMPEDATALNINLAPQSSLASRPSTRSENCALQIRLFDGSTIRSRFPSSSNLRTDVRKWIEDARTDDRGPFTFRSLFPNRTIDETEEDQSLQDLGLVPSSTLVLVRVERFSAAYADGEGGILSRLISPIVHFFTMLITFFTTIFRSPPSAPDSQQQGQHLGRHGEQGSRESDRVQGFMNPDDSRRDQQLYNGNSLNFEPRHDEDDDSR